MSSVTFTPTRILAVLILTALTCWTLAVAGNTTPRKGDGYRPVRPPTSVTLP